MKDKTFPSMRALVNFHLCQRKDEGKPEENTEEIRVEYKTEKGGIVEDTTGTPG